MTKRLDYNIEIAKEVCDAIATSSLGIKALCKKNPHWPRRATIFKWRKEHEEFDKMFSLAKVLQIEVIVDELLDIADDSSKDFVEDGEGDVIVDKDHINRARLKIDTRKWLAGKLMPKIYGDRIQVDGKVNDMDDINKVRGILHKCQTGLAEISTEIE